MTGNADIRILRANDAKDALWVLKSLYEGGTYVVSPAQPNMLGYKQIDIATQYKIGLLLNRAQAEFRKSKTLTISLHDAMKVSELLGKQMNDKNSIQLLYWQRILKIGPFTPSPAPFTGAQMAEIARLARKLDIPQELAEDRVHNADEADKMIKELNDLDKFRHNKRGLS